MNLSLYNLATNAEGYPFLLNNHTLFQEKNDTLSLLNHAAPGNRTYITTNGSIGIHEKSFAYVVGERVLEPILEKITSLSKNFFQNFSILWEELWSPFSNLATKVDRMLTFQGVYAQENLLISSLIEEALQKLDHEYRQVLEKLEEDESQSHPKNLHCKNDIFYSSHPLINHLEELVLKCERKMLIDIYLKDKLISLEKVKSLPPYITHSIDLLIDRKLMVLKQLQQDFEQELAYYRTQKSLKFGSMPPFSENFDPEKLISKLVNEKLEELDRLIEEGAEQLEKWESTVYSTLWQGENRHLANSIQAHHEKVLFQCERKIIIINAVINKIENTKKILISEEKTPVIHVIDLLKRKLLVLEIIQKNSREVLALPRNSSP